MFDLVRSQRGKLCFRCNRFVNIHPSPMIHRGKDESFDFAQREPTSGTFKAEEKLGFVENMSCSFIVRLSALRSKCAIGRFPGAGIALSLILHSDLLL